jgi:hypothetical protein
MRMQRTVIQQGRELRVHANNLNIARKGYAAEAMARRRRQTMCSESVAEQLSGVDDVKTSREL